jgi:ammonium transporter, Amt family
LGKRYIAAFQHVDDVLDVFHTHLVASIVGGFFTGVFATDGGTGAFALTPIGGADSGNGRQVWVQLVGVFFIFGWNLVWTSLIMAFIKYVLRVPLRMSDEQCIVGDYAVHEEESYTFAYYNRNLLPKDDIEGGHIIGQAPPEEGKEGPIHAKMARERAVGITHNPVAPPPIGEAETAALDDGKEKAA